MTAESLPVDASGRDRARRRSLIAFLVIWALWGAVLTGIRVHHPGMDTGEGWSDADIVNAGRFFDREGYGPTKALPRLDTASPRPGEHLRPYNSYPPGPFWIHQGLKAAGLKSLESQRVASQVWTHLGELLLFLVIRRLSGNGWLALLATCLHMFSLPYAGYSSGFWINMGQTALFAALYGWLRHESAPSPRARTWWLAATCSIVFADFWIVLENGPAIAIFVGVRALMKRRWRSFAAAAAVCAMPALVMAMRVAHTGWQTGGGVGQGVRHFLTSGASRSIDGPPGLNWASVVMVWTSRLGWPLSGDPNLLHNQRFMYPVLGPLVLAAWMLLLGALVTNLQSPRLVAARRGLWAGVLLLAGGASWTLLMRNHVWTHQFTVFTLMPGLATILGSLVWAGVCLVPERNMRLRPLAWLPVLASLVVMGGMMAHLRKSDVLNHGWELDKEKREAVQRSEASYAAIASAGQRLHRRGVERLLLHPKWPPVSHALGVPFVHAAKPPNSSGPTEPGEAWALETWVPTAREIATGLSFDLGLPDVLNSPSRLVIFPSRGGRTLPIEAVIEGFGRVDSVRISATLDGGGIAMAWRMTGAALGRALDRVTLTIVLLHADGREIARAGAWMRITSDDRAVVWATLPAASWRAASRVRMFVWDGDAKRLRDWEVTADLPDGVSAWPSGDRRQGLVCDLAVWGPWVRPARDREPQREPQPAAPKGQQRELVPAGR